VLQLSTTYTLTLRSTTHSITARWREQCQ